MNQYKVGILRTFLRENILKIFFFRRMRPYEVLKGMCLEKLILRALRGKKYQYILNRNEITRAFVLFENLFHFILRVLN